MLSLGPLLLVVLAGLAAASPSPSPQSYGCPSLGPLLVSTTYGPVRGRLSPSAPQAVREFLGIPYAAPPVGAKRWTPPVAPARWQSVRNATQFGPSCYEAGFIDIDLNLTIQFTLPKPPVESEDCLLINVWAPTACRRTSPGGASVLLWIHGGGFTLGGTFDPTYYGSNIVRDQEDIIVVSFNYRLTAFGFPAGAPGLPTNFGLQDVRRAVEWTRDNIVRFGGNPGKITLFGESAGSVATDAYLHAATADPIIRGAIMQSGTTSLTDIGALGFPPGEAWKNLTAAVGCGNADLACMRGKTALELRAAVRRRKLPFTPVPDNTTLFADYPARLAAGNFARVPLLVGSNDVETPGPPPADFYTAFLFTCPASRVARAHAAVLPDATWQYRFFGNFPTYPNFTEPGPGAFHGSEITQVFGTYDDAIASDAQRRSSKHIQGAWAAFARDPAAGLKQYAGGWPTFASGGADGSLVRLAYDNLPGATFVKASSYEALCAAAPSSLASRA